MKVTIARLLWIAALVLAGCGGEGGEDDNLGADVEPAVEALATLTDGNDVPEPAGTLGPDATLETLSGAESAHIFGSESTEEANPVTFGADEGELFDGEGE